MHFPLFFHPLSIIFFTNMLFGHIFGKIDKYAPLSITNKSKIPFEQIYNTFGGNYIYYLFMKWFN